MHPWIKRIRSLGIILLVLEGIAWVGLARFGALNFTAALENEPARTATDAIATESSSGLEKCSAFDGDLFCIEELPEGIAAVSSERCATHDGELYCIAEDA
jgi:hypothetical protein